MVCIMYKYSLQLIGILGKKYEMIRSSPDDWRRVYHVNIQFNGIQSHSIFNSSKKLQLNGIPG